MPNPQIDCLIKIAGIALTPPSFRDPLLGKLGRLVGRLAKSSRRRAQIGVHGVDDRFPLVLAFFREAIQQINLRPAARAFRQTPDLRLGAAGDGDDGRAGSARSAENSRPRRLAG
jgi:lauroyl/myristoyl acyltransferase